MDMQLGDRSALVTGASSGIGRATARVLAEEGVRLAVHGRDTERLAQVATEIEQLTGRRPAVVVGDLLEPQGVESVASQALGSLGHIDILVNNAGGTRPFHLDTPAQAWDEALMLNFTRQRELAHRLLPDMLERGWGRIINVTGKHEPESINGAACGKAATHAWAKGLSRVVGRRGVTVNCVAPGHIETDQITRLHGEDYRRRQIEQEIPLGRYGEPAELAHLIAYLASPLSAYVTGTVIPVDGGLRRYQF